MDRRSRLAAGLAALLLCLSAAISQAAIGPTDKIADVRATKHNLSAAADGSSTPSGGKVPVRAVKASAETQVCVFCHTPHAAESLTAPLWNRKLSGQTYTPYSSSSMDADAAEMASAPGGSSKLCLSCHDGTMAIDKVNALNGALNPTIAMTSAGPVKMPSGAATTGFTRDLGTDLSSDHPISLTYDASLAGNDGELRGPDGAIVGNRVAQGARPRMPLENGQIQCATCHDPHLRDRATSNGNAKFLRMNRFQATQPSGGSFSPANDIICLACHDKAGVSWAYSAHANSQVATQTYTAAAAQQREFPSTLDTPANTDPPVWQVACLNCHDTHTVAGARRLLREGTDSLASPKAGGKAALEETCYQCHSASGTSVITPTTTVPDIKSDFSLARHMPITTADQADGTTEVHDIGGVFSDYDANCSKTSGKCGKDLLEASTKLGLGALNNRHAECSDCHNPHRVVKFRDFRGNPAGSITGLPDPAGTHPHTDTSATNHTNIASGVLRGSWGVEPNYPATAAFTSLPTSFDVKRGDPGTNASALVSATYVTREYQICLKCHSNYGYSDNGGAQTTPAAGGDGKPAGNRPTLLPVANTKGGTPTGTNGMTMYTNQAMELRAPAGHDGPATNDCNNAGTDAGAASAFNNCNHRSWHPVIKPTGRTTVTRGMSGGNPWLAPWNNQVGANTMYCSDCHGSGVVTSLTSVIPENGENGSPWGPHGSANDFVLKGQWTDTTGANSNLLCFKCHAKANYTTRNDTGRRSGFYNVDKGNLHNYHVDRLGRELRCTWCHVAVPHGWKNKALLVNLNDLGPEVGMTAGTKAPAGNYTNGPYYYKSVLRVSSFAKSGAWVDTNCGGKDYMKNTMCASVP
jgi:Doubled CXXCH motif (Paired_CXXCH_1)